MCTDKGAPRAMGVRFAIEFYGVDHFLYRDDYPCWTPESALRVFEELGLGEQDRRKIL